MEETFGGTLERVRKQKNIPINQLVEGIMTPSTYHRFKKGEIETGISKFNALLARLNVRYEEFLFLHNRYREDPLKESLLTLEELFNRKDVAGLQRLQEDVAEGEWTNSLAQKHLLALISLMRDRLLGQNAQRESNSLLHYLEQTETWTHYEVAMFGNCMKALPTASVDFYLNSVVHSFTAYKSIDKYSHEISRILINAVISFLSRKEVRLARKWYTWLAAQSLRETFLFESFFVKLLGQYLEFAEGNESRKESFPFYVEHLVFLGCDQLAQTVSTMNHWMEENYGENRSLRQDLPHLEGPNAQQLRTKSKDFGRIAPV